MFLVSKTFVLLTKTFWNFFHAKKHFWTFLGIFEEKAYVPLEHIREYSKKYIFLIICRDFRIKWILENVFSSKIPKKFILHEFFLSQSLASISCFCSIDSMFKNVLFGPLYCVVSVMPPFQYLWARAGFINLSADVTTWLQSFTR